MSDRHQPLPGCYYISRSGQLIKVRAIMYADGHPSRVILEYLDGTLSDLGIDQWDWLDLARYTEWLSTRKLLAEHTER